MDPLQAVIRRHSRPLEPIATNVQPRLSRFPHIRAVLFDVYGTLLISGAGDISHASDQIDPFQDVAFRRALVAAGVKLAHCSTAGAGLLRSLVAVGHAEARGRGILYPEVDILAIWRLVLDRLLEQGLIETDISNDVLPRLALEYESLVNPTWPMPKATECLRELTEHGLALGIVSNAQRMTQTVLETLFGRQLEQLGFDANLQWYSYAHACAKPDETMYRLAAKELSKRGVVPHEVVYVGNDMLNDVLPAARTGFRTILFAGDARSLRLREGDERVAGLQPDAIITSLADLLQCLVFDG